MVLSRARMIVAVGLLMAVQGCHAKSKDRRVAAEVAGQKIYVEDLDAQIVAEVFELRSMALHKLVADKVLAHEAARRKLSLSELWKQEVDQKVPAPDEATALRALQMWVAEGHISAADAAQISPQLAVERLRRQHMQQREDTYYDSLVDASAVQIDFAALGKPSLNIADDGPSLGPANAPVTVVEFADLTKSFTSLWQPTLEKVVEKYRKNVRFVFKQKPTTPDSPAAKLAEASLCANDQKKYWEFRKALLRDAAQKPVEERLDAAIGAASLDRAGFDACLSSGRNRAIVASNVAEAASNHLEGEPVVSVNGIRLSGAHPFATVDRLLRIETSKL
jgi:protein-disulfide isomerase